MTILRTVSLVLASSVVFASAASAEVGQRDGARRGDRGDRGSRPITQPNRPTVTPTVPTQPVVRPQAVSPVIVRPVIERPVIVRPAPRPAVIVETRRPYGFWWKRDRYSRDFRGRHDRRWYRWW